MSTDTAVKTSPGPRTLPFYRLLAKHLRDPMSAFEGAGKAAAGEIVRLNMGPFRPYLVTHPDHVQHVLRGNQPNYVREGMFWDPLVPLLGDGILSDGESWQASRRILQPLFTAKHINSIGERILEVSTEHIEATIRSEESFDIVTGMANIVHPTIVRLFFGDNLSAEAIALLIPAYDVSVTWISIRLILPFIPSNFPLPGDRAFWRALRTINDVVYPWIQEARANLDDDHNVVSVLCRARSGEIGESGDRKIRDDLVSMYGASTETTATALNWVWVALDAHPDKAAKVYEEIDRVVGENPLSLSHLPDLRYLRMFLYEILRLYPPGWLLPRRVVDTESIGGVMVKAGSTVVISPYLTHRLEEFWDRPLDFEPERFAPENEERRHRYAYFPFGGGPHQCLGQHLFMLEAQLVVAGILSRFRPVLNASEPVTPQLGTSLRPKQKIKLSFVPVSRG